MVMTVRNKAATGAPVALDLLRDIQAWFGTPISETKGGFLVVPAEMSPEEWIAREEEENKHRKKPEEWGL